MIIHFDTLITGQDVLQSHAVVLKNGLVESVLSPLELQQNKVVIDKSFAIGAPGFVDMQVNGGGGFQFNEDPTAACISKMFAAHQRFGTTSMLPTVITDQFSVMRQAADAIAEFRKQGAWQQNAVLGIHYEGPWICEAKRGIHESRFIRKPTTDELDLLRRSDLGQVMVTLAPENVAPETIRDLVADGIIVFLAHSNASYEQTIAALEAGARGFTHLFNAMSPFQSREPGMVGTALSHTESYAGIIVDGHHVHNASVQAAINAKGTDKIALVTDAMALAACDQATMDFFGHEIVRANDKLTLNNGTLAGACLTMIDAVRNTANLQNVNVGDAIQMATHTPARAVKCDARVGSIQPGLAANILGLSENAEQGLQIDWLCQQGETVF